MRKPIGLSVPYRRVDDDDDIQDYKKPWRGLTDEEMQKICGSVPAMREAVRDAEAKLKEKNT
jgi:hypothetical protein